MARGRKLTTDYIIQQLEKLFSLAFGAPRFTNEEKIRLTERVLAPLIQVLYDQAEYPPSSDIDCSEYLEVLRFARVRCNNVAKIPVRKPVDAHWVIEQSDWITLINDKVTDHRLAKQLERITLETSGIFRFDGNILGTLWNALRVRTKPMAGLDHISERMKFPEWLLEQLVEYAILLQWNGRSKRRQARLEQFERLWPFLLRAPPIGFHRQHRGTLLVAG